LKEQSITHLYVDTGELRRLQTSYRYFYQGRERLGMLDDFNWELFGRFAKEYLHPVWAYPPQARDVPFPWARWPEFLEQPHAGSFIAIYELH
jgi:hypothetical protein